MAAGFLQSSQVRSSRHVYLEGTDRHRFAARHINTLQRIVATRRRGVGAWPLLDAEQRARHVTVVRDGPAQRRVDRPGEGARCAMRTTQISAEGPSVLAHAAVHLVARGHVEAGASTALAIFAAERAGRTCAAATSGRDPRTDRRLMRKCGHVLDTGASD